MENTGKMVICPNCGAEFDVSLVRCPYCDAGYAPAEEEEYMGQLEEIRKEEEENREKMNDQQRLAQAFIDQARKAEEEAAEEAEEK